MSTFDEAERRTDEEVIELVEDQRDLLIAVATGTSITPALDRDTQVGDESSRRSLRGGGL